MKALMSGLFATCFFLAGVVEADGFMEDWTQKFPSPSISRRVSHAMTNIGGDRVILFGGYDGDYDNETWVYDLSNNKLSLKIPASKPSPRRYHAMAGIGEDQVLLFGGWRDGTYNDETWIYDWFEDTWTQVFPDSFPAARYSHAMAYVGSDKVLLFGGNDNSGYYNDTWVYDLSETTWTQLSLVSQPSARRNHAMADIGGDQVLLFGGWDGTDDDETWIFDLSETTWVQVFPDSFPSARRYHAMAGIGENLVLLFGGYDGADDGETWVYDLVDTTWTQLSPASQPSARDKHAMACIGDDKVLLFGGHDGAYDDETWVYDLNSNIWTKQIPVSKPSARHHYGLAYTGGDEVLLFGGSNEMEPSSGYYDDTWIYNLGDTTWTEVSPDSCPFARYSCPMAYIGGDQVLLFGGKVEGNVADNETWVYDRSENTWTKLAPSNTPSARWSHAMAYIGEDKVILYGGVQTPRETWIYDLSENTWVEQVPSDTPSVEYYTDMAYIGEDRVLLFGGIPLNDETWIYDLSENAWVLKMPMETPVERNGSAMAYLGGDQVLLFGGGPTKVETWIYDLGENNWTLDSNAVEPPRRFFYGLSETSMDGSSHLVLFGGRDDDEVKDDTWTFGGGDYIVFQPPQVTLIYPNGGETLVDSATIAWTATDPDLGDSSLLVVDLDYSANAGDSWSAIAAGEANDGSYLWDISGLPDGINYLVRITVTDPIGLSDSDVSNTVFTIDNIPDPPQVVVIYPNGGENLTIPFTITWTATDIDPGETALLEVNLDYSENAGATWAVIDSNQANDGTYFWDITGLYGTTEYLVRITVTDTTSLSDSDVSDAVFTIDNPTPRIVSIDDVPDDQGQHVLILWDRSYLDAPEYQLITDYSIWRRHLDRSEIMMIGDGWGGSRPREFTQLLYRRIERINEFGESKAEYWEYIGSVDAHYFEGYAYVAATMEDSSDSGVPYFTFLVSAQTADPFVFWDSAPDSGYSVDDITPAKTQMVLLAGGGSKGPVGTNCLVWDQVTTGEDGSPERGPIDYRVYCDETYDFVPGPGNLVATTTDLLYVHTDGRIGDPAANLFYLVTAVDGSGNESAVSNVVGEFDKDLRDGK